MSKPTKTQTTTEVCERCGAKITADEEAVRRGDTVLCQACADEEEESQSTVAD